MTKSDLSRDLLADLKGVAEAPVPPAAPGRPSGQTPRRRTPTLHICLTPLRWARPGPVAPEEGAGVGLRMGPWRVTVSR